MIVNKRKKEAEPQSKLRDELTEKAFFNTPCASVNECTGITPTVPADESEARSYKDIYDIPVTARGENKKGKK